MRPKIFVVEGRNDESRLKQIYPTIEVITTNGSAIDPDKVEVLQKLDETHVIILFLDPDHAGERIRRILGKSLTHVFHAFIDQNLAHSKNGKKIGIEHASTQTIQEALKDMKIVFTDSKSMSKSKVKSFLNTMNTSLVMSSTVIALIYQYSLTKCHV